MKLGILGGGQLARMMALAAYPLGIRTVCYDPTPDVCAGDVTELITADYSDLSALDKFLANVDCITIESENIPLECAKYVSKTHSFYPSVKALDISQDRLVEKRFFNSLNMRTAKFIPVNSEEELEKALQDIDFPAVLKTRRFGYDGKGQYHLKGQVDRAKAWQLLKNQSLILEQFISFECELSLIAARSKDGQTVFYPLNQNSHKHGVLQSTEAPFVNHELQQEAQIQATRILDHLNYVGVLTIEYFYDGHHLIVNEIAPRVHNSGHWTIDGAQTSQFENHLRAIFDLPLGSTEVLGHCFMLNCLEEMMPIKSILRIPELHYHTYAKASKPGRKVGHITLVDQELERYHKSKHKLLNRS